MKKIIILVLGLIFFSTIFSSKVFAMHLSAKMRAQQQDIRECNTILPLFKKVGLALIDFYRMQKYFAKHTPKNAESLEILANALAAAKYFKMNYGNLIMNINNMIEQKYGVKQDLSFESITINGYRTMLHCPGINYGFLLADIAASRKIANADLRKLVSIYSKKDLQRFKTYHITPAHVARLALYNAAFYEMLIKIGVRITDKNRGLSFMQSFLNIVFDSLSGDNIHFTPSRKLLTRIIFDLSRENCNDLRDITFKYKNKKIIKHVIYGSINYTRKYCERIYKRIEKK